MRRVARRGSPASSITSWHCYSERRPRPVRGDKGLGKEATRVVCEAREVGCLFRLSQGSNVKKVIARPHFKDVRSPADSGFEGYESTAKLAGWTKMRRVVVLLRRNGGKDCLIAIEAAQQLSFLDEADIVAKDSVSQCSPACRRFSMESRKLRRSWPAPSASEPSPCT